MAKVGNWVGELTTTSGTGDVTLGGPLPGHTTFSSIGDGEVWYVLIEGDNREAGKGTLTGDTLVRTNVYSTLVNGSYDDAAPTPIVLGGLASAYCTFNRTAFDEFTEGLARLTIAEDKLAGIEDGATADQIAAEVPYDNTASSLAAAELQAAVDELNNIIGDVNALLLSHLNGTIEVHPALAISFDPATSTLTSIETQAAIDELDAKAVSGGTDLQAHIDDPTAAHAASSISFDNAVSGMTATEVQAAINELKAAPTIPIETLGPMNKAVFQGQAEQNLSLYAGSGFVEYGKRYDSSLYEAVNEGMQSGNVSSGGGLDLLYMGAQPSGSPIIGSSRTAEPLCSVVGVIHKVIGVNSVSTLLGNALSFPPAPDGTKTYDSETGVVTTFGTPAEAFDSLEKVVNGTFDTDSDWTLNPSLNIAGGMLNYPAVVGGFSAVQGIGGVSGEGYLVTLTVANYVEGNIRVRIGESGNYDLITPSNGVYTLEVEATGSDLKILSNGTTSDYSIDNISVTKVGEDVIVSRQDFVMLESWHEVISDKDVVYPLGNVQYGATTWNSIPLSSALVAQGYSAFGEWDTSTVGYGITYSTLGDAEKLIFLNDVENNIYQAEDGELVQVRYRVRVIEGYGDDWANVDSQGNTFVSYDSLAPSRILIRAASTAASDYTSSTTFAYRQAYAADTAKGGIGLYTHLDTQSVLLSYAQAIPIALVQRRNQGAYHPSFNEWGTKRMQRTDSTSGTDWYGSLSRVPLSTEQCLLPVSQGGTMEFDGNAGGGTIGNGVGWVGRPDDLFYDAIYAADVKDLRNSARTDTKSVDYWLNKAVANDLRHYVNEGTPYTVVKERGVVETLSTSAIAVSFSHGGTAADYPIGSFVISIKQDNTVLVSGYVSFVNATTVSLVNTFTDAVALVGGKTINRTNGDVYTILKVVYQQHERETLTWTDVIGDPANYPRQWTGVVDWDTSQGVQAVSTGDAIENEGTNPNGIVGNIYVLISAGFGIDLGTTNLASTADYTDLGTKAEFLANARGFEGFPLLYGENGEDYTADLSTQKLKRKFTNTFDNSVRYTEDSGVVWSSINRTFDSTPNNVDCTLVDTNSRVWLVNYETPAHIFTDSVNAPVFNKELSTTYATLNYTKQFGGHLGSDLVGKVMDTNSSYATGMQKTSIDNYLFENTGGLIGKLSVFQPVTQVSSLSITAAGGPAYRTFTYQTNVSNQLMLNSVFKEMIFDVDWGDNSQFTIADNTTTETDDNGNTILVGTKQTKLPFFARVED